MGVELKVTGIAMMVLSGILGVLLNEDPKTDAIIGVVVMLSFLMLFLMIMFLNISA